MTSRHRRRTVLEAASAMGLALTLTKPGAAQDGVRTWRQYAKCRFGQIHMVAAAPATDTGKSPLVCLHQSPVSGDYYREFQALMAADRLVLCPDTPGYGSSDPTPSQPDMAALGGAMAEALTDLGYG